MDTNTCTNPNKATPERRNIIAVLLLLITIGAANAATITVNPNLSTAGTAGEVIEILGTGTTFAASAAARVYMGAIAPANKAPSFTLIDDTHIIFTTVALQRGSYDVIVTDAADTPIATLTLGLTFCTANRVLQISVMLSLGKSAAIAWGASTDNDDTILTPKVGAAHAAGSYAPYLWFVRDSEFGGPGINAAVNLGATYSTDGAGVVYPADGDNSHTLTVTTTSKTNSPVRVDAITSDDVAAAPPSWIAAVAAGNEAFKLEASLNGGATQTLGTVQAVAVNLLAAAPPAADMSLRLQISTPLASTTAPGTLHTITMSLIAVWGRVCPSYIPCVRVGPDPVARSYLKDRDGRIT